MHEWEYITRYVGLEKVDMGNPSANVWGLQYLTDKELAELGSEGWELVSVIYMTNVQYGGGPVPFENVRGIQYIFKRPKH